MKPRSELYWDTDIPSCLPLQVARLSPKTLLSLSVMRLNPKMLLSSSLVVMMATLPSAGARSMAPNKRIRAPHALQIEVSECPPQLRPVFLAEALALMLA